MDLPAGENRKPPYNTTVNPAGQTPALELDDGSCLTEITAICEYLEERHPSPALIGTTPGSTGSSGSAERPQRGLASPVPLHSGTRATLHRADSLGAEPQKRAPVSTPPPRQPQRAPG